MEKQSKVGSRLPALPAGAALALIGGAGVVSWYGGQLLFALAPNDVSPWVWGLIQSGWAWFLLSAALNGAVLRWASRPAYWAAGWADKPALLQSLVLLLGLAFHLLSLLWILLLGALSDIQIGYGST